MTRSVASDQVRFALRFAGFGLPLFAAYTFPYDEAGTVAGWFQSYLSAYAQLAGAALALIELGVQVSGQDISGRFALRIVQSCDAMEAVILFTAAVSAFPAAWLRRLAGIVAGTAAIVTVNVARICSLYYVGVYRPARFEFYHLEVWPLVLIGAAAVAFIAWTHWVLQTPRRA